MGGKMGGLAAYRQSPGLHHVLGHVRWQQHHAQSRHGRIERHGHDLEPRARTTRNRVDLLGAEPLLPGIGQGVVVQQGAVGRGGRYAGPVARHPGGGRVGGQIQRSDEVVAQAGALAVTKFERGINGPRLEIRRADTRAQAQRDLAMGAGEGGQARDQPVRPHRGPH